MSVSLSGLIHSVPSHLIYCRSRLTLSSYPCPGHPNYVFPSDFQNRNHVCIFFSPNVPHAMPILPSLLWSPEYCLVRKTVLNVFSMVCNWEHYQMSFPVALLLQNVTGYIRAYTHTFTYAVPRTVPGSRDVIPILWALSVLYTAGSSAFLHATAHVKCLVILRTTVTWVRVFL